VTRLIAAVAAGALVYAGVLYRLDPNLIEEGKTILGHLRGKKEPA
jgi:hypothetical protein